MLWQWAALLAAIAALVAWVTTQIVSRERQRDFIALVSHELRTPVAQVRLFTESLAHDRTISPEQEKEYLDAALRASERLTAIIDNTLNLARLDTGGMKMSLQTVDTGTWLSEYLMMQRERLTEKGFILTTENPTSLPQLRLDRETIALALDNLFDNAVKYSAERKEVDFRAAVEGRRLNISVADRGLGIPQRQSRKVFQRFYRIKPVDRQPVGGAGLGLTLVKEIVERHGGRASCAPREGGGTVFCISLPLKAD